MQHSIYNTTEFWLRYLVMCNSAGSFQFSFDNYVLYRIKVRWLWFNMNIFILLTLPATNDLIQLNVNRFTYIHMEYSYLITIIRLHIYTYEIFLLDNNNLFTEFIIQPISVSCRKNKHWSNTSEDVGAITINQKNLKKGKKIIEQSLLNCWIFPVRIHHPSTPKTKSRWHSKWSAKSFQDTSWSIYQLEYFFLQ